MGSQKQQNESHITLDNNVSRCKIVYLLCLIFIFLEDSVYESYLFIDAESTPTNSQQSAKPESVAEESVDGSVEPKSPQDDNLSEEKGTEIKESNSKVASENDVSNL